MPTYVFKCERGHTFEERLTFEEFDEMKELDDQMCDVEDEDGVPCSSQSEVQTQPVPFKM